MKHCFQALFLTSNFGLFYESGPCTPSQVVWFGHLESLPTLILLASDEDQLVRDNATNILCYFGIEALAALPFIKSSGGVGYDPLFLAKVIRHICYLVFVPGGQQILPSAKIARIPSSNFPNAKGEIEAYRVLLNLKELIFLEDGKPK